jgi:glycogen(starch) synthase
MVHRFHPEIGGVEVTAEVLARGFAERYGDEVTVVTHTTRSDPAVRFPFRVLRAPSMRELFAAIRDSDVVFHNNPCMQFYAPQLLLKRPWVVALRMWITLPGQVLSPSERLKYALKYRFVESADLLLANSNAVAGHIRGVDGVIHNSFRDGIFRNTNPGPRDRRRIAYVGRLSADKGLDMLLPALRLLVDRGLDPRLTIIGEGDQLPQVEALIAELDLADRVELTGRLSGEETAQHLNEHAISVVPSTVTESFGTVALEEAACGTVVAVAGHGGLLEAIGDAGPTFPPHDPVAIADVVERLMTDDEWYAGWQAAAVAHVDAHRENVMVDAYHAALEAAVADPASSGIRGRLRQARRFLRGR